MFFLKYENGISFSEAVGVSVTGIIVVLIVLAILAVLVMLLSKAIRLFEKKKKRAPEKSAGVPESIKPQETALPVTQSAGTLELYKTDEKTAAVIMAIVSNECGIELNRLQFNSIKLIEEQEG